MNEELDKDKELEKREKELQERERQIRLREMEDELYKQDVQPPLYQTSHHNPPEKVSPRWYRKMIKAGKFAGIVIAVAVAANITIWMAAAVLVLAVGFVTYKIMFSKDKD